MRIAILSYYNGQIDRGVEVATVALTKELSRENEVTLFQCGKKIAAGVNSVQLETGETWPVDTSGGKLRFLYLDHYSRNIIRFTVKFLKFFFKYRYDVVIPMNGGWQIVIVRIMSWMLGKKILVQGNAGIGRDDHWQLLWRPDFFIALSPDGFEWVKRVAPQVRSVLIPYGVDVDKFKHAKAIPIEIAKPIVLCVAAFLPYKRLSLLIQAVASLKHVSLLLIGHGPDEEKLRELCEKLLPGRYLIKTQVTHQELPGYYKAADVFSLPSESSEAFGIVYVEALAVGIPVVAPDDKNRRAIVGSAGVFVNPLNIKEYSVAINRVLTTKFASLPQVEAQRFRWSIIGNEYLKLLKRM